MCPIVYFRAKPSKKATCATAVIILVPPDAPSTNRTLSSARRSSIMIGAMLDIGLLPGSIKFDSDGLRWNTFTRLGVEKSSI